MIDAKLPAASCIHLIFCSIDLHSAEICHESLLHEEMDHSPDVGVVPHLGRDLLSIAMDLDEHR